jgi:hypothetical protein
MASSSLLGMSMQTSGLYQHLPNRGSRSAIEHHTLEGCGFVGGTNLKIVLSTAESGHFAVAVSREQKRNVVG